MASFLAKLDPTPAFPSYSGPYGVGSIDVEVPVSELQETEQYAPVHTVACRIFYPCDKSAKNAQPVYWVQQPQHATVGAFAKFLGASGAAAELFAYVNRLLYRITIPAVRNAALHEPKDGGKWPVMVFSHGLGGSRNSYSYICGSLASHGMVVVAPEHRDGSGPVSHVRGIEGHSARSIDYLKLSHTPSPDVYAARDQQLQVRLWELGLVHEMIERMEKGTRFTNLNTSGADALSAFQDKLCIAPGSIAYCGHSFGGATMVQFTKSLFYHPQNKSCSNPNKTPSQLLQTTPSESLLAQVTAASPTILLDPWSLPLNSPLTSDLKDRPLPWYTSSSTQSSPLLAILSAAFVAWPTNFRDILSSLAPPKSQAYSGKHEQQTAHLFYPLSSAHLSQSDFALLFPWLTRFVAKAADPEHTMALNLRAILQMLRHTCPDHWSAVSHHKDAEFASEEEPMSTRDDIILRRDKDIVKGWLAVSLARGDDGEIKSLTSHSVEPVADSAVDAARSGDLELESKQSQEEIEASLCHTGEVALGCDEDVDNLETSKRRESIAERAQLLVDKPRVKVRNILEADKRSGQTVGA